MASRGRKQPFYIVGLPEDSAEAADAELKFGRLSDELTRAFPFIEEMRAVVKSKKPGKLHARYDVSVDVYTPKGVRSFSESGYNLASVFDALGPKMKRMLSSKRSRVTGSQGATRRKQV